MRAVVLSVPEHELKERHRRGADRWDEVWEGVLHMSPPPGSSHQEFMGEFAAFLVYECRRRSLGTILPQAGLYDKEHLDEDYRVPDIVFVSKERRRVIQKRGAVGGADAVVEVLSPDDESYEKLPFFARLGVAEVIFIDPETREPDVHHLLGKVYSAVSPDREGWLVAEVLRIRFRWNSRRKRLRVEALDDPKHALEL